MVKKLKNKSINFDINRSKRATRPRIDVNMRGVKVVIPKGSGLDPQKLIEEKRDWIEEKLEKFEQHRKKIPVRKFEAGATWPFLGEGLQLKVTDSIKNRGGKREMGRRGNGGRKIKLSQKWVEKNSIEEELELFYREAAREYLTGLVEEWGEKIHVDYNKLYIRNQRTKWASCSGKANLSFNFRLMMAPPAVVEYIVIHELCHLKRHNHGPKFKRLLAEYCPDFEKYERWLEENSVRLIFTEEDL